MGVLLETGGTIMLSYAMIFTAILIASNGVSVHAAFTAAQKTELVIIHNRLREAAFPTPAKMNFLTWNTRLERLAQTAAEACTGEHNYGGEYASLGENIYKGFRSNATEVTLTWFTEKAIYTYRTATCTPAGSLTSCGHYLQLVTDTVMEIGCGHHMCTGSNMVYCEYGSGSASPPYASANSVCARCPTTRTLCLNGFCVNRTMVTMADVQAYDPTATASATNCKLNCSNCGVASSIAGVLDCYCECPGSASGSFCETKTGSSTCSVCKSLSTPCQNGGTEKNATTCQCQCPDSYVGSQCQLFKPHYLNSMRLGLVTQQFCALGQCVRVPLTRTVFKASIWSGMRSAIATAVNSFCNSNAANYALCCSTGLLPSTARPIVAAADIGYLDNADMETDDSGVLFVAIYANISANNLLCPSTRRKRNVNQPMLTLTALQSTMQLNNASVSDSLGTCCSTSVMSVATYQSYAGPKYGVTNSTSNPRSEATTFDPKYDVTNSTSNPKSEATTLRSGAGHSGWCALLTAACLFFGYLFFVDTDF